MQRCKLRQGLRYRLGGSFCPSSASCAGLVFVLAGRVTGFEHYVQQVTEANRKKSVSDSNSLFKLRCCGLWLG